MRQPNIARSVPRNGHHETPPPKELAIDILANPILSVTDFNEVATGQGSRTSVAAMEKMPDKTWQLPALATFVTSTIRRSGTDAWWIGKALNLARALHKLERDWLRWLTEEVTGLGRSTAYRYMDVCNGFELEEVEGKTINVLYKLMGLKDDGPKASGKDRNGNAPATGKDHTDDNPEDEPEPPEPPQPPLTAAEIDALTAFLETVGGLTRATYVFQEGIEQLREMKDEEG